ncbi:MAG: MBL fold metallo-hydrolase [Caldilinea sp. CFX5]|nr:MBL fold metallo-hydrolase [Caldilinea sp. CFX5]
MRREGHTLQSYWNKGSWTDEYQYAILRDEWRQRARPTHQSKVVLLGTGTPNADPLRHGSAVAIVVGEQAYLVDFGPGIVRRAAAAAQKGIKALEAPRLTRAFLTHHHSDHTVGYPDLIFTPWVLGRSEPLVVYGPPGTQAMTNHILAAYAEDMRERREGLEPSNDQGHRVVVHEYGAGRIYSDENVQVEAFRVDHGSWPAFGFRFTTPDRTIVISGDTRPFAGLADHYRGADLLLHEVYSVRGFANRPAEWQRYHSTVHTSAHELAALTKAARPGLLVLTHQLFWGVTEADLVAEVQAHYDGPVVSGRDLDVF